MMTSIFRTSANPDPNEAMVASQQKHIAELVAQNKTLEHTLSRLRAEAATERERTEGVRGEWAAERIEWRAGCDALQDAHRAAHLRTAVALDGARGDALAAREAARLLDEEGEDEDYDDEGGGHGHGGTGRLVAIKMMNRALCDVNDRTRISFVREVEVLRVSAPIGVLLGTWR